VTLSHLPATAGTAGGAAISVDKKDSKYQALIKANIFMPIAVDTHDPINS